MSDLFAHHQGLVAEGDSSCRIAEYPLGFCAHVTGTSTRIVAAVKLAMVLVPVQIIEATPRLRVLKSRSRIASEQTGRPGAMMRLQTQFIVSIVCRQLLQLHSQPTAVVNPARTIG